MSWSRPIPTVTNSLGLFESVTKAMATNRERQKLVEALLAIGEQADDDIGLADAGLLLAALDDPDQKLDFYHRHLATLVADVAARADQAPDATAAAMALSEVLAGHHGYRGDSASYDDPANANLIRVIDRRRGLPVALGILWLHAGRAAGFEIEGLSFPGHFLLRLRRGPDAVVLDPFNGGRVVAPADMRAMLNRIAGEEALKPEHHRAVSAREILLRLLNNLKSRALQAGDADRAAEMLSRMVTVAPRHQPSWRELALVRAHEGKLNDAIAALGRLVELARTAEERREAEALLAEIRSRLN